LQQLLVPESVFERLARASGRSAGELRRSPPDMEKSEEGEAMTRIITITSGK